MAEDWSLSASLQSGHPSRRSKYFTFKHANNNLSIRGLHRLLDPLITIPVHPTREIQTSVPSCVRVLRYRDDVHDDLVSLGSERCGTGVL